MQDNAGRLYGTTIAGGNGGEGTAYELISQSPTSWTEGVLHSFCPQAGCTTDGAAPASGLVLDAGQQTLFGTTTQGGAFGIDGGVVFELTRSATATWSEGLLYSFCAQGGCVDGFAPDSRLAIDDSGDLYGTTRLGGTGTAGNNGNGGGVAFELSPASRPPWHETVLYSFCQQGGAACSDGAAPTGGVTAIGTTLYGEATFGGAHGGGIVFAIDR